MSVVWILVVCLFATVLGSGNEISITEIFDIEIGNVNGLTPPFGFLNDSAISTTAEFSILEISVKDIRWQDFQNSCLESLIILSS
jgi:hypothetical protein